MRITRAENNKHRYITYFTNDNIDGIIEMVNNDIELEFFNRKILPQLTDKYSSVLKTLVNNPKLDFSVNSNTILVDAVKNEDVDLVKVLLKNPKVDVCGMNYSAFAHSTFRRNIEIFQLLYENLIENKRVKELEIVNKFEVAVPLIKIINRKKKIKELLSE